jgi:hypothetical protein
MANTLFIVKDADFTHLPSQISSGAVAEVKRLFGFLRNFTVSVLEPVRFPERLDFTDSIVKIVEDSDSVQPVLNQALRVEMHNVVFSATQHRVNLQVPPGGHSAATPDRGGVGTHQKEIVDPNNLRLIVTITGGVAAVDFAKEAVLENATGGRTIDDIESSRNRRLWGPSGRPQVVTVGGERETAFGKDFVRYFASHQSLKDTGDELTWGLLEKGWSDWPKNLQNGVAVALGRLIAHEARHQYILQHSSSGLGADEPRLFGDKNFENFEKGDQNAIISRLAALRKEQSHGTTHLETLPTGQSFPFS